MSEETETLEQKIERLVEAIKDCAQHVTAWQQISIGYHNALAAAQAELDKQKSAVWRPEIDRSVWILATDGDVEEWSFDGDEFDQSAHTQGNFFPTREAAERERDRRILIADMRRWAAEHGFRVRFEVIGYTDTGERSFRDVPEFAKRLHLLND